MLHVITTLQTGGAESMLAALVLAKRPGAPAARVVSLLPGGATCDRLRASGVDVTDLGMTRGRPSGGALIRLTRLIRAERPHVIQGWMYHANLMATLALALSGRRRRTRLYWGIRCSDMDPGLYGWSFRLAVRACAWLSRVPDAIIANSESGRDYHRRGGYRARCFDVIDNGIDTARFRPDETGRARVRAELGIPADLPLLALVARVDPMKDHAGFLDAFRRLSGVGALAVGEGTDRLPELPGLYRLGMRSDVPGLLAACDFVVSSSAFGEGFSNTIAEGMACGLPPVATGVGDTARIIGDAGLVVPPRDPAALAAAITALLNEPPSQRAERGRRARRRIEERFSLSRAVEAFDALHRENTGCGNKP